MGRTLKQKKITIIGCGQMGSRHLQAIVRLNYPLKIQVVERNASNINLVKQSLREVLPKKHFIEVEWYKDIAEMDSLPDITIVATKAQGRSELLKRLVEMGHDRFLVEKMVCQSKDEYEDLLEVFENDHLKCWVNCVRPYFPFYERTIKLMQCDGQIMFNAMAGSLGLGTNAIHLLNLFLTIVGDSWDIQLKGDFLSPTLLPNKRGKDLVEFCGTIVAKTSNSSFASVNFHPENNASVVINIISQNWRVFVDEGTNKALLSSGESGWVWEEGDFKMLQSSELTTCIVNSILQEDECKLPSLQECYFLHKELFRIFNGHIKFVTGKDTVLCPIT